LSEPVRPPELRIRDTLIIKNTLTDGSLVR
jgi:hypothetical protein